MRGIVPLDSPSQDSLSVLRKLDKIFERAEDSRRECREYREFSKILWRVSRARDTLGGMPDLP